MCGRYTFVPSPDVVDLFEIENTDFELRANYNVAPGQVMPVVAQQSPQRFYHMKWGLVPFWAKDPRIGYKMINARGEELPQKPSFRAPLKNKRCLIPATGFYEWDKSGKTKIPYYFKLKHRNIFAFAGLYDIWKDPNGQQIYTYTIITTEANGVVGKIHNRMPVILRRKDEKVWADNSRYEPAALSKLIRPYADEEMDMYMVSTQVNSPAHNEAALINRLNSK